MHLRFRGAALATVLAAACGGDAPAVPGLHARAVQGTLGSPLQAVSLLGLFTIPLRVDGAAGPPLLVDTGSPATFIAPGNFGVEASRTGTGTARLGGSTFEVEGVPVVYLDPLALAPVAGGIVGADLLCQFPSTWDFQRTRFTLGAPPADVDTDGDAAPVAFTLRGGGTLTFDGVHAVTVPATRIVVDAVLEGRALRLLVDLGASTVALRDDLVSAIAADGRRTLRIAEAAQGGTSTHTLLRVRSLGALGVSRERLAVLGISTAAMQSLSSETGVAVDGLLGVEFFRPWLSTVDYPALRLRLRHYRDQTHVTDPWTRAGVLLAGDGSGATTVGYVAPGSAAEAAGFRAGEHLVSVDARPVDGVGHDVVDGWLRGAVGETRRVATDARTAAVAVEDLLPLP